MSLKHFVAACLTALCLTACAGVDVNMRGWQVRGFASLPLQTPLVDARVTERDREQPAVRLVHDVRHVTRVVRVVRDVGCRVPRWLLDETPYMHENYVRNYRHLQRYIKANCHQQRN